MVTKNIFFTLVVGLNFTVASYAMEADAENEFAAETNLNPWDILTKEIDLADNMRMAENAIERFRTDEVNFIKITMNHLKDSFKQYGSYLKPTTNQRYNALLKKHENYLKKIAEDGENAFQENVIPQANPPLNPRIAKKLFQ